MKAKTLLAIQGAQPPHAPGNKALLRPERKGQLVVDNSLIRPRFLVPRCHWEGGTIRSIPMDFDKIRNSRKVQTTKMQRINLKHFT